MSNKLKIQKGTSFTNNFLNTIGKVVEDCIVNITPNQLNSLGSTSDGTLIQYVRFKNENEFEKTLNVPDVKRLHKIISCISSESFEIQTEENCLSYKSPETRFKFYLLDDGILSPPPISVDKIKSLEYDSEFTLSHSKLLELVKGSTFSNESEKLYIYTSEGYIYGELTDREKPNMDSFCIRLTDEPQDNTFQPLAFNFENIRIISSTRCEQIKFRVNTQMSVIRVDIALEDCYITYIVSALIK